MKRKLLIVGGITAALLAAQSARVLVNQSLSVVNGMPGWVLTVAPDGSSVIPAPPHVTVFGSSLTPGCPVQSDGSYLVPGQATSYAIYRNGVRQSTAKDYSVTAALLGDSIVLTSPAKGDVVLCDYTY